MARFNYQDLPDSIQKRFQEETGLTHEELLAGKTEHTENTEKETGYNPMDKTTPRESDWWMVADKSFRFVANRPKSFLSLVTAVIVPTLFIFGLVFLIATIATQC